MIKKINRSWRNGHVLSDTRYFCTYVCMCVCTHKVFLLPYQCCLRFYPDRRQKLHLKNTGCTHVRWPTIVFAYTYLYSYVCSRCKKHLIYCLPYQPLIPPRNQRKSHFCSTATLSLLKRFINAMLVPQTADHLYFIAFRKM